MKVINVSEILPELDQSIKKKENEKEQVLDVRDALSNFANSKDAFKGKGADAITDHITLLHTPAILMLNLFIENYTKNLGQVKSEINDFENENAVIKQDFLEQEAMTGIETIRSKAETSINGINQEIKDINDIIGSPTISLTPLNNQLEVAKFGIKDTMEKLTNFDEDNLKKLKESTDELNAITDFINQISSWQSKGITLDSATIEEIDKYFAENDTVNKLVDNAVELSLKEGGDTTAAGNVADWLDKLGKMNGGVDASKGAIAASILMSKRLIFTRDGKGNFIIKSHPDWVKSNGVYKSKLADTIHKIMKKGKASNIGAISKRLSKYSNAPGNLLRELVGLKPGTNKVSYRNVLKMKHKYLEFSKQAIKNYSNKPFDFKKTVDQFKSKKGLLKIAKKIPYAGIVFSAVTNAGEYVSDKNKYKTLSEKTGRAVAGIGMDVGVAGLTTAGAGIGTLICPGVGTVIGGAIGASVGIVSSIALENQVKDLGEKTGKWVEDTGKKIGDGINKLSDKVSDKASDVGNFVTGLFR